MVLIFVISRLGFIGVFHLTITLRREPATPPARSTIHSNYRPTINLEFAQCKSGVNDCQNLLVHCTDLCDLDWGFSYNFLLSRRCNASLQLGLGFSLHHSSQCFYRFSTLS